MPSTPSQLSDLQARPAQPAAATYVFCTACDKITVTISLQHSDTDPLTISFKAERRPNADQLPTCCCEEAGWVQLVHEGAWRYDNATRQPHVAEELPEDTPASVTFEPDDPDEEPYTVDLDIWYGEQPKNPQREIEDTPGPGNDIVESGENGGATIKRFVSRFVCRSRGEDGRWKPGRHQFDLRWTLYHHANDQWTQLKLTGTRPTERPDPSAPCPLP